jgi:hypothetical protein
MAFAALRLVHFVFMATWFGTGLFALRDVRTALAAGPAHVPLLRQRMRVVGIAASASGALTLLSGFGLIFALGGFASVPAAIHMGLGLAIVTAVVGGAGIGGTWRKIDAALEAGADPATVAPLLGRLRMFSGAFQGCWFATLLLMVFRGVIG